jgi:prevent-host-death family protein
MVSVGVREFKNHLSEYLRRVKAGEVVEVTQRGKPVARLLPSEPASEEKAVEARIWEMVAQGKAHWSGRRPVPRKPVGKVRPGVSLSDLIVQERDESLSRFERHS